MLLSKIDISFGMLMFYSNFVTFKI